MTTTTTTFKDIQTILNEAVNNEPTIGVHGKFWEISEDGTPMTRDKFVGLSIFGCKIIDEVNWNGPNSHLVQILLEGACEYPRMPRGGFPFLSNETVQIISDWISNKAPDTVEPV